MKLSCFALVWWCQRYEDLALVKRLLQKYKSNNCYLIWSFLKLCLFKKQLTLRSILMAMVQLVCMKTPIFKIMSSNNVQKISIPPLYENIKQYRKNDMFYSIHDIVSCFFESFIFVYWSKFNRHIIYRALHILYMNKLYWSYVLLKMYYPDF